MKSAFESGEGAFETRVIYSYPLEGTLNSFRNWHGNQAVFNALKTLLSTRWLYKNTLQWKTWQRQVWKHFSEWLSLCILWVRRGLHSTQHPPHTHQRSQGFTFQDSSQNMNASDLRVQITSSTWMLECMLASKALTKSNVLSGNSYLNSWARKFFMNL